ncbi:unnamed protein product [Cladocopium goreaui]|uniref:RRM domain-containing protein n=1 Tax=Cladocopium goreaui TaxID=2562237 RepID=A0A9P1CRW8_9DINO|nr:unnamed protein product [Cladocopium goreaui]
MGKKQKEEPAEEAEEEVEEKPRKKAKTVETVPETVAETEFQDPALDNDDGEPTVHSVSIGGLSFDTTRATVRKLPRNLGRWSRCDDGSAELLVEPMSPSPRRRKWTQPFLGWRARRLMVEKSK